MRRFEPLSDAARSPLAGTPGPLAAAMPGGFAPSFDTPRAPKPEDPAALLAKAMETARTDARREGYAEGHAAGLAEAETAQNTIITATLTTLPAALTRLTAAADNAVREEAVTLAGIMLATIDAALPAAAARAAPDAAALLAARLAPLLAQEIRVALHVAPDLAEAVAARIDDPRLTVTPDPRLQSGELRAEWRGGTASFDLAARRAAIRSALAEAGLALENDP